MELEECLSIVAAGEDLSQDQAYAVADILASGEVNADSKADFLTQLAQKGESPQEVAGLAKRYRELARDPGLEEWQDRAIDVCGTGGDKQHTFNISTTVTFVVAAAGIPVFKHGNRSITSKCGSSNLLEALGVTIMGDDALLKESMAAAQHALGLKAGLIAHCDLGERGGMDEFSAAGSNIARGFGTLRDVDERWSPEEMGIRSGSLDDLQGGDVDVNASILNKLLDGKATPALEDSVVANVAAAFFVAGRHASVQEGVAEARDLLLGGRTRAKIDQAREFYNQ